MLILGIAVFLIGLRGIYIAYIHYDFYWTAKMQMPDSIIISKKGKIYDDSWKYFIGFSLLSMLGFTLMIMTDKKINKTKTWFNSEFYFPLYIIFILIPFYFTFLNSKYSFSNKLIDMQIENHLKSRKS